MILLIHNIHNAYLTADYQKKIYIIAGQEFGSEEGILLIVRRALHGIKNCGAGSRAHLANTHLT
jgi:hypothetical protein